MFTVIKMRFMSSSSSSLLLLLAAAWVADGFTFPSQDT
jgi:hypothetical protein